MSVYQAQEEISSSEFTEWLEFLQMEPLPDTKRSYEAALICKTLAQVFGTKNVKLEDFLLKYEKLRRGPEKTSDLKTKIATWLGMSGKRSKK